MMSKKEKPILLFDMDSITVDMTPTWLKMYYERTGDRLNTKDQSKWEFSKLVKYPRELNKILTEDEFFFNLPAMPGAIEFIPKLVNKGADVIFLTQLPRKSDFAAKDKRAWLDKHIEKFDLRNIIFAHRKSIVSGDLLFDDNPIHLSTWRAFHNKRSQFPITATISYPYNRDANADWVFKNKSKAWEQFYEKACDSFNLK